MEANIMPPKPINIPVETQQASTGMVDAILSELFLCLKKLATKGQTNSIDLNSLPMTKADKQSLQDQLGVGEVRATISTMGDSEVYETHFSGIWWIKHFNTENQLIAEILEVTNIPDILKCQQEDINHAIDAFASLLRKDNPKPE